MAVWTVRCKASVYAHGWITISWTVQLGKRSEGWVIRFLPSCQWMRRKRSSCSPTSGWTDTEGHRAWLSPQSRAGWSLGSRTQQCAQGVIHQQPHAPAEQMEHRSSPELQLVLCWVNKIPSMGGQANTHTPAELASLPSSQQALFSVSVGWRDAGMAAGSSSLDACDLRVADFGMWLTGQESSHHHGSTAKLHFPCTTDISLSVPTLPLQNCVWWLFSVCGTAWDAFAYITGSTLLLFSSHSILALPILNSPAMRFSHHNSSHWGSMENRML